MRQLPVHAVVGPGRTRAYLNTDAWQEDPVAAASPDPLRIRILGAFEVEGMRSVGSRKARTLLKLLSLARGQPVAVSRLADCLWPNEQPRKANKEVSVLVSRLRSRLGTSRIVLSDAGYSFKPDWLDLCAAGELAQRATQALAKKRHPDALSDALEALKLFSGPLLADELDAEWADAHRVRALRLADQIRMTAAQAALAVGDVELAAELAEAHLEHEPFDELALRVLMSARAAAGRPALALAAYARFSSVLRDELGISPSPETNALHVAVLKSEQHGLPRHAKAEADVASPVAPQAPGLEEPFVARDAEIAALSQALSRAREHGPVMVLLEGERGIGKTRLLDEWSSRVCGMDVLVLHAQCRPSSALFPLSPIFAALADHLGGDPDYATEPADPFPRVTRVFERLAKDRPVLLAIDDLNLCDDATRDFLRSLPGSTAAHLLVVATSTRGEGRHPRRFEVVHIGPLDLFATAQLVAHECAGALYARTGGNPMFIRELRDAPDDTLPPKLVETITLRLRKLGNGELTLRAAALLGDPLDLDVLTAALGLTRASLLEHIDAGLRFGLLEERGSALVFRHGFVRETLVATTPVAIRHCLRRAAAQHAERSPAARHDSDSVVIRAEEMYAAEA